MKLRPARRINGRISLPGDKSISHRAAIVAALATGRSKITNYSPSEDCESTLACLRKLGVSIQTEGVALMVDGSGVAGLRAPSEPLDCGNSGSTMRMLAGVLAGQNFSSILTGDTSLRSRPMQRIIEPLQMMGTIVRSVDGRPPLTVTGSYPLKPISYQLPVASAQVKTCVLFAGLLAEGRTVVSEIGGASRDHTERMLKWFGVDLQSTTADAGCIKVSVDGPAHWAARDLTVPGDISSAAFLIAAAALLPDSHLEIVDVALNPTRTTFFSLLRSFGLHVDFAEQGEQCNEPVGSVHGLRDHMSVTTPCGSNLVQGGLVVQLIDELPLLAVVGTQLPGGIEIRDAGELRHKESDRIRTTVQNLRAMGADVEEFPDGLRVQGREQLRGARLDSYGDHRIAMSFSVAALLAEGESEIVGADCVSVSFPNFFEVLESIVER